MSIALSTSTAAPSGSSIILSTAMVFTRASRPAFQWSPEQHGHRPSGITLIRSIARPFGPYLEARREMTETPEKGKSLDRSDRERTSQTIDTSRGRMHKLRRKGKRFTVLHFSPYTPAGQVIVILRVLPS